jgi:hypothetical protein
MDDTVDSLITELADAAVTLDVPIAFKSRQAKLIELPKDVEAALREAISPRQNCCDTGMRSRGYDHDHGCRFFNQTTHERHMAEIHAERRL